MLYFLSLNLQFSSSAELLPANNTQLQNSGSAVNYTELDTPLYQSGYLSYDKTLYKINADYHIYMGSDDKLYFATTESDYAELTTETVTTVLEPVTATLTVTPNPAEIAVGGTATLTAALDSEYAGLTVESYTFSKKGDSEFTTYEEAGEKCTVTGAGAGTETYQVTILVKTSSGEKFNLVSDGVSIKVTG